MQLVADRFAAHGPIDDDNDSYAIDLATAQRVRLVSAPPGTADDQRQWLMACDDRARIHAFGVPRLIDFGLVGEARRFEAWEDDAAKAAVSIDANAVPEIALV